jgi:predicted MPP superfamily phosphohydrolase
MGNAPSSLNSVSPPRPLTQTPTSREVARARLRRFSRLIIIVQSVLLLAHFFLYETWLAFHPALTPAARLALLIVFPIAAVSFVAATLLAWRTFHWLARIFYKITAVWIGLMNFGLFAACFCWIALGVVRVGRYPVPRSIIADASFTAALIVGVYGIINAAVIRIHRVTVKLPNLPDQWNGRVAALVSDMHLGHVRNLRFMRRIVARLNRLEPNVVLIAGDMYDGTAIDPATVAQPWSALSAPLGAFFVTGNHEEFTSRSRYLDALSAAGVRVLNNEKIDLRGLQIIGMHYQETIDPRAFRAVLQRAAISPENPSLLLVHAPHRLPIAEEEGISLLVCGHTHGGQFPPGSWVAARIYGCFVHGLNRFGNMLVFTNWGVGTWGPPLRVGTQPEIVLLQFARA